MDVYGLVKDAIRNNRSFVLRKLADAIDHDRDRLCRLSKQDQLLLHALLASRQLFMEHRGKRFTQKELKERTVALWEKSIQAKIKNTDHCSIFLVIE